MTRTDFAFIAATVFTLAFFVRTVVGQDTGANEDWGLHVIPAAERSFDFKTVAKGAVPEHRFVLRNPFQEPIHIESITSGCTCTTIDFDEEKSVLQTYDEAVVPVRLRGDMFDGQRNSTITVSIDKPYRTEIQLNIRGEIRSDLKITPDRIDFGNVELEKGQSRTLTVTYTGSNTQWRLVDVKCENEFIHTDITSGPVQVGVKIFQVNVSLDKSAPNGTISSHLILISNDALTRREIPVPLRATVGTVIRVSPPALSLGVLLPGEPSPVKNAVLVGTKPFRIVKMECDNPAVEITPQIDPDALPPARAVHQVSVLYRNPADGDGASQDGTMRTAVRVTTDIPGLAPVFYVTANIRTKESEGENR